MPESVKNRPTKSHEYIFMLAKNKKYYYDHIAILEPAAYDGRKDTRMKGSKKYKDGFAPTNTNTMCLKGHERWPNKIRGYTTKQPSSAESQQHHGGNMSCPKRIYPTGSNQTLHDYPHSGYFKADGTPLFQISTDGIPARNKRDVWVSSTAQFKANQYMENPPADHFAVAPIAIIEPCILAGTSEKGVCSECGNPWKRIITHKALPRNESRTHSTTEQRLGKSPSPEPTDGVVAPAFTTEGWEPSCNCNAGCVPPIVLDPFCGSGTTGVVALKNGRRFIGIDLNMDYCELAKVKIIKDSFRGDKDE